MKNYRVRYAPSPTGEPHIGNMRSALFNWLFARHHQGKFFLRIEDTDQNRIVPNSLEKILEALKWLKLDWDDDLYIQSKRLDIYQKHAQELVKANKAYYCYCSEERLRKLKEEQKKKKITIMYDGRCRSISNRQSPSAKKYVIRLKVPKEGQTEFNDQIRGKVSFENKYIDDQILLKSDGWPTYHLANVVDDHLMEISHVIRGEEWLSSTPKHILLYQAFNWPIPQFVHLPMILGSDKKKLSKRHGSLSVLEFRDQGYLAEALLNFIALLGWHPKEKSKIAPQIQEQKSKNNFKGETEKEIFSREELIKLFRLEDVQKGAAIFDFEKLNWMNGYYIRKMNLEDLTKMTIPFLEKTSLIKRI